MKWSFVFFIVAVIGNVSCERHEFEGPNGTKQLHIKHTKAHGDAHAEGDHAEDKSEAAH